MHNRTAQHPSTTHHTPTIHPTTAAAPVPASRSDRIQQPTTRDAMLQSHPVTSLKLFGLFCPCLEQDASARNAAWALSAVSIQWHRSNGAHSSSSGVSGFLSMFSSSKATPTTEEESTMSGTLSIADTTHDGPCLIIDCDSDSSTVRIPLRHLTIHASEAGEVVIGCSKEAEETKIHFEVLDQDRNHADETTTNEVLDNLQIIAEWEKRRQDQLISQGINEDDQYPESSNGSSKGNALTDKARQIQHFAQREIEMQKTKREREARKAKYVKDAGGLKYTAIAMANRT